MAKHSKLYDKSPKLERDEDGEITVKKEGKEKTVGQDGSSAEDDGEVANASKSSDPHEEERKSLHKRHEEELSAMHDRHRKDLKEMHQRHEADKRSGSELINKVEDKEED